MVTFYFIQYITTPTMNIYVTNRLKARISYFSDFRVGENVRVENKPFLKAILNNKLEVNGLGENKLLQIISTLAYLGMSTRDAIDELVYCIVRNEKLFNKYFVAVDGKYKVNENLDYILKNELKTRLC
jgi:hypothetical protein